MPRRAGLRPRIAQGMGGLDVGHRHAGRRPGCAPGIAVADVGAGPANCAIGIPDGAVGTRKVSGPGPVGIELAPAGHESRCCDFQGGRAGRWPRTSRARPATTIRPRSRPACFKTKGRLHQPSRRRAATSTSASAKCIKAPELMDRRALSRPTRRAPKNRDVLNAEIDKRVCDLRQAPKLVEKLNKAGVPGRTDL